MAAFLPHSTARSLVLVSIVLASVPLAAQWTVDAPSCVPPGGTIDVIVRADSGGSNQGAAQWRLTWDPGVYEVVTSFGSGGASFQGGWQGVANEVMPGELLVASWHLSPFPTGSSDQAVVRLRNLAPGNLSIGGDVEIWVNSVSTPIMGTPFAMTGATPMAGCGGMEPSCTITSPSPGGMLTGMGTISVNIVDPSMGTLDVFYSYDAGSGPQAPSRVGGGMPMDLGVAPGPRTFMWNLNQDFLGPQMGVTFEIVVINSLTRLGSSCSVTIDVDITNMAPTCVITSPAPSSLVISTGTITFDTADGDMHPLDITYEYNAGMGFMPATRVGGGASMDLGVAPGAGMTFDWDAFVDTGAATGVEFRITVDDLRAGGTSTCSLMVDVRAPNNPPACNIFFPGGGTLSGTQTLLFSASDADSDPLDLLFEFDAGSGFVAATAAAGSALANPATGVPPAGSLSFEWDVAADFLVTTPSVVFRISADDGFGGMTTCMRTYDIDVPQTPPTCTITSPTTGTGVVDMVTITYDAMDAEDLMDITYEFDAGAGFVSATRLGGGSSMDLGVASSMGLTFDWDLATDLPMGMSGVVFRISLDDGRGGTGSCTVSLDVAPAGACPLPALCGDCNEDGVAVNILDSLTAAQIAVGVITPGVLQFNKCNVVGAVSPSASAAVDILDSLNIAQAAAGLPIALSCC